jgi:deoxyribodipyrimidine photo-lyase
MRFPVTRDSALARLEAFLPLSGPVYAAQRNHHYGGPEGEATTSLLSPAIRHRLLSEAEVAAAVVAVHGIERSEMFVQEVCWRSYWVGWLRQRPEIWTRWRADVTRLEAVFANDKRYQQAVAGQTGIDCFDAWVSELKDNGWLHNHVRMNFASIWCYTLRLPWQLGAAFFYYHLLDACPASNTLSWRWIAGLHTKGKAYLARADLIRNLSGGRFQVEAPLAQEATPWPPDNIPSPIAPNRPAEADVNASTGLLVTTEDLSFETLTLPVKPVALAGMRVIDAESPLKRGTTDTMLDDGLARASAHFNIDPVWLGDVAAVRDWAARHRLQQIVTADVPIGPVKDQLDDLTPALAADGVQLIRLRRAWDEYSWPHANKGFFQFKSSAIPGLLSVPINAFA